MVNPGTLLKRTVSHILSIVLSTTTESLNIFHKILIEISALKNIKVKIKILQIIFDKFLLLPNKQ